MEGSSLLRVIACAWLFAHVLAAPPLVLPTSGRLSVNDTNLNFLLDDDRPTPFPPFPPPNPYILHVGGPDQWHDVLLSIRWIESEVKPRDETATREVIALAMKDVLAHAAVHDQYIPLSYELRYEVKDVVLHRFDRTTYYTWDLWKIVLEGIEQFVKAYDGIYFLFKIFLGEKTVRQQLGTGALSGP